MDWKAFINDKGDVTANTDGSPDWNYMEQYVKNLMFEKYQYYFDFTNE